MGQIHLKTIIWKKFRAVKPKIRICTFTKTKFFGKLQNLSVFDLNLSFFAEGLYSLFQQICSE